MAQISTAGPIDLTGTYRMISGIRVIPRSRDSIQIGAEPPRWLILHRAPANSVQILCGLDGSARIADVLADHDADPLLWSDLLTSLRDLGLLVPVADWTFPGMSPDVVLEPERNSLVYRHGMSTARRLLIARQESLVVVRGSGRVATAVAGLLAASGIGHIYQEPDRPVRSADLIASFNGPVSRPNSPGITRDAPGGAGDARLGRGSGTSRRAATDAAALAAALRRISRSVRTHPPAAHQPPALVVLAGDTPTLPWAVGDLLRDQIPHLLVRAQLTSAVVGPLVLPGRSTCLLCVLRHRSDIDLGWPTFEAGMAAAPVTSPAALVWTAASLAVMETLTHLDGIEVPATVDGSVEWWAGELAPRRRTWSTHPDCGCQRASV